MSLDETQSPTEEAVGDHGGLIALLEQTQAKYGYLPEQNLREIARTTDRSLVDVYGVATFYKSFSLEPRGRHLVSCCLGTACHVQGGPVIAEALQSELGVCSASGIPGNAG